MKGVRLIAAALCALLMLSLPVMADDGLELPGVVDPNDMPALEQPAEPSPEPSPESPPAPEPAPPAEPPAGPERDDNLWGDWKDPGNSGVRTELPSEAQQELEEARRQQGGRCRPHRAGAAPAGSENRQPGAVHPHRGAAGRGPLHCHLPVYPPGAGGRPRR